jgi:hypothetical protein
MFSSFAEVTWLERCGQNDPKMPSEKANGVPRSTQVAFLLQTPVFLGTDDGSDPPLVLPRVS